MAELVQGEKEHSDWSLSGLNFALRTAKMDHSRSDFTDLFSLKDIQKETIILR